MVHAAEKQLELVFGSDRVVRINIDGECVLRVLMLPGSEYVVDDRRTLKSPLPGDD